MKIYLNSVSTKNIKKVEPFLESILKDTAFTLGLSEQECNWIDGCDEYEGASILQSLNRFVEEL